MFQRIIFDLLLIEIDVGPNADALLAWLNKKTVPLSAKTRLHDHTVCVYGGACADLMCGYEPQPIEENFAFFYFDREATAATSGLAAPKTTLSFTGSIYCPIRR